MNEVLRDKLGCFLCFTASGAKGRCGHSSGDEGSQSRNVSNSKVAHLAT